jgi:hypothetical protein
MHKKHNPQLQLLKDGRSSLFTIVEAGETAPQAGDLGKNKR